MLVSYGRLSRTAVCNQESVLAQYIWSLALVYMYIIYCIIRCCHGYCPQVNV